MSIFSILGRRFRRIQYHELECLAVFSFLRLVSVAFVIAVITIRIFTGGSLDSSSSKSLSNVSLLWNPVCGVDLGSSSGSLSTLWTTWIFLVWLFSFSYFSVVKEHFLQINFSESISSDFQTNNENGRVQFPYLKVARIQLFPINQFFFFLFLDGF